MKILARKAKNQNLIKTTLTLVALIDIKIKFFNFVIFEK
jgi:hypothetical protein